MGTDPHIQTLLASLTALHPRLVTAIEDTERKMGTSFSNSGLAGQCPMTLAIATCIEGIDVLKKYWEFPHFSPDI